MSQPDEAAPEEALCRPPHEAWPLARVLCLVLMKMGRAGPPFEPRRRPQVGKSGDPRSQNADSRLLLSTSAKIIKVELTWGYPSSLSSLSSTLSDSFTLSLDCLP